MGALTVNYDKSCKILTSAVNVFPPGPIVRPEDTMKYGHISFNATWDTGATCSAISKKIVNTLGLKRVSRESVVTPRGVFEADFYYVTVLVNKGAYFKNLRLPLGEMGPGSDMLIGMDIIGSGDFAVTNLDGKTTFTFRSQSRIRLDFLHNQHVKAEKTKDSEACPCGSDTLYRNCCKKNIIQK